MSFQNNNAADAYQDFMLPTALDSDFSSEDLADDMEGLQLTMQRVKIPGGGNLQFEIRSDYDVVLLKAFFAVNDMYLPLSPTAVLKLVADDKLQFQIRDRVEGFSEWKENELKKLSA